MAKRDFATSSPFVPNPMMLSTSACFALAPSGCALAAVVVTAARSPRSARTTPILFQLPDIRFDPPREGALRPRFAPVWERNHIGSPLSRTSADPEWLETGRRRRGPDEQRRLEKLGGRGRDRLFEAAEEQGGGSPPELEGRLVD